MALQSPDLGESFTLTALNKENQRKEETVKDGVIRNLQPGVYLLKRKNCTPKQNWTTDSRWNSIRLGEFAAPSPHTTDYKVIHNPAQVTEADRDLTILAQVVGNTSPDSVIIYLSGMIIIHLSR